jgi:cytochrome c oxidase cbb3-type subunit 1
MKHENESLVNEDLIYAHLIASVVIVAIVFLAGLLYSMQFLYIYPFPGISFLSPGRLRSVHTNGAVYGFIVNGFTAALYWAVPRLTGKKVFNEKYVGWFMFIALQAAVLGTVFGLLHGDAQAIPWGETPWYIDPFVVVWLLVSLAQFTVPIYKHAIEKALYAANWYIIAGLVWIPMVYIMGNYFPTFFVPGIAGAAITGTWIHDAVGLYVTPIGWGLCYYFIPVILKKPVWSHSLSLLGFWGLAFFYPLQGVHHYLWTPIPMYAQYAAVLSTVALELAVVSVIVNFMMTLKGRAEALKDSIPLRWIYIGIVNYAITCFQCAIQVLLTTQKVIHFTDWVVGHAHLIMFGTFGFWILGFISYLWPKVTHRQSYSKAAEEWAFWLILVGIELMWIDLLAAGLVQGFMWWSLSPWMDSIRYSFPFWIVRAISGVLMSAGLTFYIYNFYMTARNKTVSIIQAQQAGGSI